MPKIQSEIKHFGVTEVEIDFDHIPDTIDTNEPTFSDATPDTANAPEKDKLSSSSTKQPAMIASIKLKKHKDVIYEMYKIAKQKALEAKKVAIRAYLEAKEIIPDVEEISPENIDVKNKPTLIFVILLKK